MHALCGGESLRREEVRLGRPSIVATLLWAFGIAIIGLTVYCMLDWSVVGERTCMTPSSYLQLFQQE